jgi:antitoxin (DNA-binding transcriptional repressor) of toxin-antitoxin stability system
VTLTQSDVCELLDAIRAGGDIDVIRKGVDADDLSPTSATRDRDVLGRDLLRPRNLQTEQVSASRTPTPTRARPGLVGGHR